MASRTDLKVTIDAEAAKLEREIQRTERSMDRLGRQIQRTDLQAAQLNDQLERRTAQALEKVGRGMLVFGAATLAGLGLATKAAIDWESAWAGVRKTVEGSPEELAAVESGLRELATTLPATHGEIAAVAEAAGQLGIATPDIVGFTRVMVDLGETTNLTADEAATAIAQLMNVMQTAPQDVGRLGSALVELGNNGASTERDIIEMAQRISGAGAIIGLAEHEVLAISNALASVGIKAEAGGSAVSTAMIKMASAVAEGGEAVTGFAEAAGVSADEFVQAFEDDPARAIQMFVEGLGRIDAAGGNVFAVLDDLGLGSIRTRDALLRLAGSGDLLAQSFDDGARAWEENTALIEEAEKRYDTAEAKIQIARNAIVDLAIDIGGVLLPMVASLAEGIADLAGWFSDLPGPVKTIATILAGLTGAMSLLGGAFLLLAPKIAAARDLMLQWGASHRVAFGAMISAGQLAGLAAGFVAVIGAIELLHQATVEAGTGIGEMTEALLNLRKGRTDEAIDRLIEKRDRLADRQLWADIVGGLGGVLELRHDADELANELESVDTALAGMVQGGSIDAADESVRRLAEAYGVSGDRIDEWVKQKFPGYVDALAKARSDNELTAESMEPVDQGLVDLATQFGLTGEDAEKAAQEMLDAWGDASIEFVDFIGAYNDLLAAKQEAERETAQETADATSDQTDSWEDYVKDVKVSIGEYLKELEKQVEAQQNWQENMLTLAGRVSAGTLDELAKLGPEGAPLVQELVDASDEELARFEELMGARSEAGAQNFAQRLAEAEPVLKQIARDEGQEVANSIAAGMAANSSTVFEEAKRQGVRIDRGVGTNRTRDVPIGPFLEGNNMDSVRRGLNNLTLPRSVTITANLVSGSIGNLFAGRPGIHSGGEITASGLRRFHGGGMSHDERLAVLQTGERVLNRGQNRAWNDMADAMSRLMPSMPAMPMARGGDGMSLRIEGAGPGFDWIVKGVRAGQLRLSVNGSPVRAG